MGEICGCLAHGVGLGLAGMREEGRLCSQILLVSPGFLEPGLPASSKGSWLWSCQLAEVNHQKIQRQTTYTKANSVFHM